MAARIRLRRTATTKRPAYRVVVADGRAPRDGRFVAAIGYYNPLADPPVIRIDADKATAECHKIVDAFCDVASRCKIEGTDNCQEEGNAALCGKVVGVSPSASTCQTALDKAACPAAGEKFSLPTECNGVVKQTQSSSPPSGSWQSLGAPASAAGLTAH